MATQLTLCGLLPAPQGLPTPLLPPGTEIAIRTKPIDASKEKDLIIRNSLQCKPYGQNVYS